MLARDTLETYLRSIDEVHWASVEGDGYHDEITVVSNAFEGLSSVRRQQWVYRHLKQYITSAVLHAVTLKTWTITEWEQQRG